jgi:CAAX prenyl protease-like protein
MPATKTCLERAHTVPFICFIVLLIAGEAIGALKGQGWFLTQTEYWVKPAQTVCCAALLVYYWRSYDFGKPFRSPTVWIVGAAIGFVAFVLWIGPQWILRTPGRVDGFNPAFFGEAGWPYWLNLGFRFARLVIVVPLIEEIFWRGFLMRWLIDDDFAAVPFGTFQLKAFALVALFFMLEHTTVDYPAALLTGMLYNLVAVRTRSLGACVLAHAVTNLLLGFYIMRTEQWGFW